MKKSDLFKLTVDQRVLVTGTQDDETFSNEPGVVDYVNDDADPYCGYVRVLFDKWSSGHGVGSRNWKFYGRDVRTFSITKEKPAPVVKKAPKGTQAYKGNGKHSWQTVEGVYYGKTLRLRVPGGWLYRYDCKCFTKAMVFVPVPDVVGYPI